MTQVMRVCRHARSLITQLNIQSLFNDQRPLMQNRKIATKQRIMLTNVQKYKHHALCSLYKNLNKLNLNLFLEFASTRILTKSCPTLSRDHALLLFSWVNRLHSGKADRKVSHLVRLYLRI